MLYELAVLTHAVPLRGIFFGRSAHLITDAAAGVLCAIAALRQKGGARLAWLLIALGILTWTAGDSYWTFVLLDDPQIPVPSLADAGYLLFPLLTFAGLVLLVRSQVRGMPHGAWLDAVAAGLAVSAVAAAVVVPTVLQNADGGGLAFYTNLAYPVTDLVMLAVVFGAVAARGWRVNAPWALAGLGIVAFWIADSHYLVTRRQLRVPGPGRCRLGPVLRLPGRERGAPRGIGGDALPAWSAPTSSSRSRSRR